MLQVNLRVFVSRWERHRGGVNEQKSVIWNLPVMLCLRCAMNHFLAASWTVSISLRRDQDGAGLIRPPHRLDDETGERILLRGGRMKVWHFFFFYDHMSWRACPPPPPTRTPQPPPNPVCCFGPDTFDPQPQHCTAGLINDLSYLWNTFTGAGK